MSDNVRIASPNLLLYLLCFALSFLCTLPSANAQSRPGVVSFQRIAIPDDVPAHLSSAMAQDEQGLIWIGTQNGLVRYDGYNFKVYQPKADDITSLSGSYVRAICVARDGHLWVGSISDGLSVFDPKTEKFKQYRHDPTRADSLGNDRVEAIVEDRDGRFWLATENGLDRFDPASGKFEHFRHDEHSPASLANNQVRALLLDSAGQLWVGTRNGLQRWQSKTRDFANIAADPKDPDALRGVLITRLFEDTRGQLWIGTATEGAAVLDIGSGLLHRLRPSSKLSNKGLSHYWVYSFTQVGDDEVWVGTYGGGIDVLDPVTLRVIDRLTHDSAEDTSIGGNRIGALMVDRSGLVWVGTWGGGIAWHDPSTRAFVKWRHSPNNLDGPTQEEIVRSMETADGAIWLGTNGNGIDIMDKNGVLRGGFRPAPGDPGALTDGSVSCMAQAADGTIWVATLDGNLHRLRAGQAEAERRFERFSAGQGLPGGPIRTMAFASDGALWVGSSNGLARISPQDDSITAYVHRDTDSRTLSGREVESLVFTSDGTLWVGTENGVNAFDTFTGKAVRIMHEPTRADSLPDNWVPDMMLAKNGSLWLATQSGVAILTKWDGRVAHFDLVNKHLHLPVRQAESLIQDKSGHVWLGSHVSINPENWHFKTYGPADGNEFRTLYIASRAMTKSGALMFGSPEGLLIIHPEQIKDWTYQPPLVVTEASVEGADLDGTEILQKLNLGAEQRNMRLEFSALDFSAPQLLHYRYRLDGYDRDWVTTNAEERLAIYTGLPPGEYQLRVQGSNRDGAWSPSELKIAVNVSPAYYQTLWFRFVMISLMLLILAVFFQYRVRQFRLRSAELERAVAERTADLEAAYKQIEAASLTDPLTKLHNRRFLEKTIQSELDLATRQHRGDSDQPNTDLVLLMLDIDHFKHVNDTYGHAAGDAVLIQTAQLLKLCMRASDYVVRWGGEEFLLVARFMERSQAASLAEKIRNTVATHGYILPDGQVIHKTVSIGFISFPIIAGSVAPVTLDTLQRMADVALYAAKRSWRNAWVGIQATEAEGRTDMEIIELFLSDAEAAVRAGLISAIVISEKQDTLRWN